MNNLLKLTDEQIKEFIEFEVFSIDEIEKYLKINELFYE